MVYIAKVMKIISNWQAMKTNEATTLKLELRPNSVILL